MDKVIFKQKVTRDHGRTPLLIDREAEIVKLLSEEEKLCTICGSESDKHHKKHSFKSYEEKVAHLNIYLPDGPEYDPWLGKLDTKMVVHLRKNVEYGHGPNQWHYIDDDSI